MLGALRGPFFVRCSSRTFVLLIAKKSSAVRSLKCLQFIAYLGKIPLFSLEVSHRQRILGKPNPIELNGKLIVAH